MTRHVIVEGPDGAGKTTLIKHLTDALAIPIHSRASSSKGGPIPDLYEWVIGDMEDNHIEASCPNHPWIYDRYPTISEPIYGYHVRRDVKQPFDQDSFLADMNRQLYASSVVVWCLPNLDTVCRNVYANANDQMPGVVLKIPKVHQAYMTAYFRWRGPKRQYDYTRHDLAWFTDELKRMLGE